jgi:hypothetical protein
MVNVGQIIIASLIYQKQGEYDVQMQCFRRLYLGAAAYQLFNEEILFKTQIIHQKYKKQTHVLFQ